MATGYVSTLPNYSGELYTADPISTPILSMIGGMNGGKITKNFEFAVSSEYSQIQAAQPERTEAQASAGVPSANNFARTQQTNVVQIFQESIDLSYHKMANSGRMEGLNTVGQVNNAEMEKAFQQAKTLEKMARDLEYTIINGVYQKSSDPTVANKTRGLLEATAISGGTKIDGGGAQLSLALMQQYFLTMFENGAIFSNLVLNVPGSLKQRISEIYGYAPTDRNYGGINIKQIETDFGNVGITTNRFVPSGTILGAEMSVIDLAFLIAPGKTAVFYEDLAKVGASDQGMMYTEVGLDYGAHFLHGSMINVVK